MLERGELHFNLDIGYLDRLANRMNQAANRLSYALVVAALLLASSIILAGGAQSAVWTLPLVGWGLPIGALTFAAAGMLGFALLLSIIRSRR